MKSWACDATRASPDHSFVWATTLIGNPEEWKGFDFGRGKADKLKVVLPLPEATYRYSVQYHLTYPDSPTLTEGYDLFLP